MRQIFYVSKSVGSLDQAALDSIVERSRHNNALDGVTGLLWVDGEYFAQVIEGDERAVDDALARIRADDRHGDIVLIHDRTIIEREFGTWNMQIRGADARGDRYDDRLRDMLTKASPDIRDAFAGLFPPAAG